VSESAAGIEKSAMCIASINISVYHQYVWHQSRSERIKRHHREIRE